MFGGRALPGTAGEAIALRRPPSRYNGENEKERVGNSREGRKGREGKDVKG